MYGKWGRLGILLVICGLLVTGSSSAVELGLIDDFSTDDGGWQGAPPFRVADGGPLGDGDGYLRVEATGGFGPGSKLAAFNTSADWIGDYAALGATAVELDVVNFPDSEGSLNLRLVFFGPNSTSNRWTSTQAVSVPNDGQWRRVSFPIDAASLTRVQGQANYQQMISDVERVMLRHDTATPSAQGSSMLGTMGFDNLRIVGSAVVGDFNDDRVVDVADINLLLQAVSTLNNESSFDLTGDALVNADDIVQLVTVELNTYIGDANLDLEFNTGDLVAVFQAGEYEDAVVGNSTWGTGDWNGDLEFGTGDLLLAFQVGGFEVGPRAAVAAVPEPQAAYLMFCGVCSVSFWRLRKR